MNNSTPVKTTKNADCIPTMREKFKTYKEAISTYELSENASKALKKGCTIYVGGGRELIPKYKNGRLLYIEVV